MTLVAQSYHDFKRMIMERQLRVLGLDIFDPNHRMNLIFIGMSINILTYLSITAIDVSWLFWGDLQRICACVVTNPYPIVSLIRMFGYHRNRKLFRELLENSIGAHTENYKDEERDVFQKYGRWLKKFGIYNTIFFSVCGTIGIATPFLLYKVTGEKTLPYGFVIPGISDTENPGYVLNYIFHIFECACVCLGYLGPFHTFTFFVVIACFRIEAIIIKLRRLDNNLRAIGESSITTVNHNNNKSNENEENLIEIVKSHQEFLLFISDLEEIFSMQSFYDLIGISFELVVTLYVCSWEFWLTGYLLLATVTVLLFSSSMLGMIIEVKADKLFDTIYDLSWHLLKPDERRIVVLLLCAAKNTQLLTCGGHFPLNLDTFARAYKSAYSLLMFLLNTHKEM
uniref:Odorant receptor n=1 Tax=Culicoides sonorensis TaxID=179676 RepID=A0A336MUP1_CULSO